MALNILKGVSLKLHSTMRLGGTADYLVNAKTKKDLADAEAWAEERQLPVRVIGEGSNIIWRDEGFKGLVIVNEIRGFKKLAEDSESATYQVGAGENWDVIIDQLVGLKLSGVECLSLIPGTAGAAPVQNIGAYGQEIAQTLVEIEAYDRMEKDFVTISNQACAFAYRTSRFKGVDNGRFLISSITLKLSKQLNIPKTYADVQKYFDDHNIKTHTPEAYRKAVIYIRRKKLPDPAKVANNGSFFGNPIISKAEFIKLTKKHPAINKKPDNWPQVPYWHTPDGNVKIAAGWLVEQSGFTDRIDAETGMTLWPTQNLVLVNKKAKNTQDLLNFQDKITGKVSEMFGVELEREPELLP